MNDFKVGDRFSVEGVVTALADCDGDYRALFDGHDSDGYVLGAEMAHATLIEPERKPRYDWSNIPLEYDWAATDRGGAVYAYINKPSCREPVNFWISKNSGDMFRLCAGHQITEDWRDSLEQRPEAVDHITPCKGTNCGSTTGMNHSPECEAEHIAAITGVPVENNVLDLSKPVRTKNNKVPVNYLTTDRLDLIWVQEVETKIVLGLFARDLENIPEPKKTVSQAIYLHENANGRRFLAYGYVSCAPLISKARITHTSGEGWSIEEFK